MNTPRSWFGWFFCLVLISAGASGQVLMKPDTSEHKDVDYIYLLQETIITSSRSDNKVRDIPARVEVIGKAQVESYPANSADDVINTISGANIDRAFGIFSKNSSITLHGLNSAQRTLVLLDGVPMNKSDGGSINWNRIDPDEIERIEVIKGPVSALYGGLAMAGAINIITKQPEKPFGGYVKVFDGTYNTFGGKLKIYNEKISNDKGFYWSVNSFYRKGDGYIVIPDSIRDTTNVKNYINEFLVCTKAGYQFSENLKAEVEYDFYDDKRGDGIRVFDPDGGYYKYTTHWFRGKLKGRFSGFNFEINAFLQQEDFHQQKESAKLDATMPGLISKYTLYNTVSNKDDKGLWMTMTHYFNHNNFLTGGFDFKSGAVNGADIYSTSTDKVSNQGRMNNYALFLQDEMRYFNNKLKVVAGLRLDMVTFDKAAFSMEEPTTTTNILVPYKGNFEAQHWSALSPKLAAHYDVNSKLSVYLSYGTGFRAPILDDMCRNGNINKGLKLANPALKPEVLDNYECGADFRLFNKILLQASVFYSIGKDFQYFVGTGDSIYSTTKPKPVLKRENIGTVEIKGLEMSATWFIGPNLELQANYAHYTSVISNFNVKGYVANDLTGKELMETAPNTVNTSLLWKNRFVNTSIFFHFLDRVWVDDENTTSVGSHALVDMKLYHDFTNGINLSLSMQNLLNTVYLDEKDQMYIGRFAMFTVGYRF